MKFFLPLIFPLSFFVPIVRKFSSLSSDFICILTRIFSQFFSQIHTFMECQRFFFYSWRKLFSHLMSFYLAKSSLFRARISKFKFFDIGINSWASQRINSIIKFTLFQYSKSAFIVVDWLSSVYMTPIALLKCSTKSALMNNAFALETDIMCHWNWYIVRWM